MSSLPASAVPAVTTLDRSEENKLGTLYRAALGPVNNDYYLPIFERFNAAGRAGPSWNRAACLCTLNWMAFRQIWGAALVYGLSLACALLLVLGLGRGLMGISETAQLCLLLAFGMFAFVAPGVWGNALLHMHVHENISRALGATATVPEACVMLNRNTSTKQRGVWLALANAALVGAALGTTIALQDTDKTAPASAIPKTAAANAPTPNASAASAPSAAPAAPTTSANSAESAASAPLNPASPPVVQTDAPAPAASALKMPAGSASAPVSEPKTPTPASAPQSPTSSAPASPPAIATPPATTTPPQATASGSVAASAPASSPRQAAVPASESKASASKPRAQAPASTTEAKPGAGGTPSGQHFYINVGLFAEESNARNAHAKLRDAGLAAFTQELESAKGKRTRVRAGPFDNKAQAEAAAEKIRSLKLEAVIFRQ